MYAGTYDFIIKDLRDNIIIKTTSNHKNILVTVIMLNRKKWRKIYGFDESVLLICYFHLIWALNL